MNNEIELPTNEEVEKQIWKIAKSSAYGDTQLEACRLLLELIRLRRQKEEASKREDLPGL